MRLTIPMCCLSQPLRAAQKSQRVGEEGIGALFGEPNANIVAAAGSIRAWRPVQVRPLACTPETGGSHGEGIGTGWVAERQLGHAHVLSVGEADHSKP